MPEERKVKIPSETGLHLRAAGRFVEAASRFQCRILVVSGVREVDGKSIIDMLTLGAAMGTELTLKADGEDAAEALDHLAELVAGGFASGAAASDAPSLS